MFAPIDVQQAAAEGDLREREERCRWKREREKRERRSELFSFLAAR